MTRRAAAAFRPLVLAAIAGLLVSGIYNILSNPGHTVKYHMLLGIKLLLVMHVFAVASDRAAQQPAPRAHDGREP